MSDIPISQYLTDFIDCNVLTLSYCRAFDIPPNKLKEKIRAQWLCKDKDLIPLLKLWGISINKDFSNFRYGREFLEESAVSGMFDPTFLDCHYFVCETDLELDELVMELTLSGDIGDSDIYMDIDLKKNVNYRVILIKCINMTSLIIDRSNSLDLKNVHKFCYQGAYKIQDNNLALELEEQILNVLSHDLDYYLCSSVKLKKWIESAQLDLHKCL